MPSTPEQNAAPAIAHFKNLVPYQSQHANNGIPRELMEYLTANRVFPVVSPEGLVGRNAMAALRGWPGLCITIAQCTPQQGPVSHNHTGTLETFYCLDGSFDVMWGNQLEKKITVQPGDLVSVPPGVYRAFRNLTEKEARLLVLIQGDQSMSDKIEMPRRIGAEVHDKYGAEIVEKLAAINMRFQGEDAAEISVEEMQKRAWIGQAANSAASTQAQTIMAPEGSGIAAPIASWPGLSVSLLNIAANDDVTATVPNNHREWLVNTGEVACEVVTANQTITLEPIDMVCVEAGHERSIRSTSDQAARVLVALQGKETITH